MEPLNELPCLKKKAAAASCPEPDEFCSHFPSTLLTISFSIAFYIIIIIIIINFFASCTSKVVSKF